MCQIFLYNTWCPTGRAKHYSEQKKRGHTMRKDSKKAKSIKTTGIQTYHAHEGYDATRQAYATQGFQGGFRVYNSDRTQPADGTAKTYGPEIELVSSINSSRALGVILEKVVFPIFPAGLFKQQEDCSLGGNSNSEVIAQPMTKSFIRNHYNDFRAMWEFLADINTRPDNTCGMHVNISMACFGKTAEQQGKAIVRLHNFISRNYDMCCALFKRDRAHTRYCGRMGTVTDFSQLPTNPITDNNHGAMCNYSHVTAQNGAARVEIRLVGPQATFQSFRNTFEVIFHLVESAKDGKNFDNIVSLFSGCNECVLDRLHDLLGTYITAQQYDAIKAKSINAGIRQATTHR